MFLDLIKDQLLIKELLTSNRWKSFGRVTWIRKRYYKYKTIAKAKKNSYWCKSMALSY